MRDAKEITFAKWGDSTAVRIPSDLVEGYSIFSGKHGWLTKDKDEMKIVPSWILLN